MLYVLQVATGKENYVADRLKEKGIKALIPKHLKYKRLKGKWDEEIVVTFKGYVFLDMDYNADNYYKVTAIENVVRLLRSDSEPVRLSFIEEEWIRLLSTDLAKEPTKIRLEKDKYEVVDGVLKKFLAKIIKIDSHKKFAEIEIDLLGEKRKLTLGVVEN